MNIDWKIVSASPGYQSLKAAYAHDLKKRYRSKKELLSLLRWVIGRAMHYAHHTGKPVEEILTEWESKRDYWWLNYYQDANQPKLVSHKRSVPGLQAYRKYWCKRKYRPKPGCRINPVCREIIRQQQEASTKVKKRWPMERKKRFARRRKQRL